MPRPLAMADDDIGGLGRHRGALALAVVGLTAAIVQFESWADELDAPPSPPPAAAVDSFPGYRSLATGLRLGARLVNRADRAYVGQITSLACPYATPGGVLAVCFQIEFADGHREWMPWREAAHRYLAAVPSVDR